MNLIIFTIKRLFHLLIALIIISAVTFVITRVLPGNPAYLIVGVQADYEILQSVIQKLGLDKPIYEQYKIYVFDFLQGNFGNSWRTGNTVIEDIIIRWPATFELSTLSIIIAVLWSIPLGIMSSLKNNSFSNYIAKVLSSLGISIPEFWLGTILLLIFFVNLGIAPAPMGRISFVDAPETITGLYLADSLITGNFEAFKMSLYQLYLPACTLAFVIGSPLLRVTKKCTEEVLDSQYIKFAKSLGVGNYTILFRHVLPNIILPVSTMVGILYGYLLGGTILVEYVYAWPGIGKYAIDSINSSDYSPVMAIVMLSAISYLIVYLIMDIFHFFMDPRSR